MKIWSNARQDAKVCSVPAEVNISYLCMGDKSYIIADARDISERLRVKDKLDEKIDKLERANSFMNGRELRIIELKEKIQELEQKLSEKD